MLFLAFVFRSLQRARGLECLICHNEEIIRSVHFATLRSMVMIGDAIAVQRRASGGLLTEGWSSGVVAATLGDLGSWQRFCRRANLTLPNYGVLLLMIPS